MYHILITHMFPQMLVASSHKREPIDKLVDYLHDMFPHLQTPGLIEVVNRVDVGSIEPVNGAIKDSLTAYITTGNGYPRPAEGDLIYRRSDYDPEKHIFEIYPMRNESLSTPKLATSWDVMLRPHNFDPENQPLQEWEDLHSSEQAEELVLAFTIHNQKRVNISWVSA